MRPSWQNYKGLLITREMGGCVFIETLVFDQHPGGRDL